MESTTHLMILEIKYYRSKSAWKLQIHTLLRHLLLVYYSKDQQYELMLWVRIPLWSRRATLYDKFCQRLAEGRWVSPVSSTNKTDLQNITEIVLKVALNTIEPTNNQQYDFRLIHNISRVYWTGFRILKYQSIKSYPRFKRWG